MRKDGWAEIFWDYTQPKRKIIYSSVESILF